MPVDMANYEKYPVKDAALLMTSADSLKESLI